MCGLDSPFCMSTLCSHLITSDPAQSLSVSATLVLSLPLSLQIYQLQVLICHLKKRKKAKNNVQSGVGVPCVCAEVKENPGFSSISVHGWAASYLTHHSIAVNKTTYTQTHAHTLSIVFWVVSKQDYGCESPWIQKLSLKHIAVITMIIKLMIIRKLRIRGLSLSLFSMYHFLAYCYSKKGKTENRKTASSLNTHINPFRHASAKMHAFISAINRRAVSVASASVIGPALKQTHTHTYVLIHKNHSHG